ncbi:XRE family transcriptional regulator [Diaphorobacter sp. DS2]|nr:XRE family transcriptional regulator [Diaphorobacter sp. DS2]
MSRRISRYELGTHEPPVKTARLIADALNVPLAYLYCEDEDIATLLLKLRQLPEVLRGQVVREWQLQLV